MDIRLNNTIFNEKNALLGGSIALIGIGGAVTSLFIASIIFYPHLYSSNLILNLLSADTFILYSSVLSLGILFLYFYLDIKGSGKEKNMTRNDMYFDHEIETYLGANNMKKYIADFQREKFIT